MHTHYIVCGFVCMTVHVYTYIPFSLHLIACACIVVTRKVVPVPSLQAPAVVLPPMLLQMVNEVALVEPLGPQWPTPVTQDTPCKETAVLPAWPAVVGAEMHLLAIVSCLQSDVLLWTYMNIKSPSGQWYCSVMPVGGSFYRHRANKQQVERQFTSSAWFRSNYAQVICDI